MNYYIMRKTFLYLTILLLASLYNYFTEFGFLFDTGILIGAWLFFYIVIVPIGFMYYFVNKQNSELFSNKMRIFVWFFYLLCFLISGYDFFDFYNFEIVGDGATRYVIKFIFIIFIVTSFTSFLFFQYNARWRRRTTS